MTSAGKTPENMLQRVKVYRLNEAGLWDDRGTGHATMEFLEVKMKSDAF